MKFLHLSDLHIGKRVNEFSMIEDQRYILNQILQIVKETKPDGVIIAGDVYDKSLPPVEGVTLFDEFLGGLHQCNVAVFLVSGNHDSAERIHFASRIMEENNIYIAGTYSGTLQKATLTDSFGPVHIHLLPFIKPAMVRPYFPEVETYQDAVLSVCNSANIKKEERNIIVAHQFITAGESLPERCDSENISIGGIDNIDASVFDSFDYVALGHLHGAQRMGRDTIRYAGSPLKYSFSEARQVKSVTQISMHEKGNIEIEKIPLTPLRDLRIIKGPIAALLDESNYSKGNVEDYIHAILTDEEEIYDAIGQIRSVYKNVMKLEFENSKTAYNQTVVIANDIKNQSPLTLFEQFFELQNNVEMSEEQRSLMKQIFDDISGKSVS